MVWRRSDTARSRAEVMLLWRTPDTLEDSFYNKRRPLLFLFYVPRGLDFPKKDILMGGKGGIDLEWS